MSEYFIPPQLRKGNEKDRSEELGEAPDPMPKGKKAALGRPEEKDMTPEKKIKLAFDEIVNNLSVVEDPDNIAFKISQGLLMEFYDDYDKLISALEKFKLKIVQHYFKEEQDSWD